MLFHLCHNPDGFCSLHGGDFKAKVVFSCSLLPIYRIGCAPLYFLEESGKQPFLVCQAGNYILQILSVYLSSECFINIVLRKKMEDSGVSSKVMVNCHKCLQTFEFINIVKN